MRKNVIVPYKLLEDQSLAASFQSEPVNIQFLDNVAIQISTSNVSDNTGQFNIQVSNDKNVWQTVVVDPEIPVLTDADANIFVNLTQLAFAWIRVDFVAAGGTPDGTCSAIVTAKEL